MGLKQALEEAIQDRESGDTSSDRSSRSSSSSSSSNNHVHSGPVQQQKYWHKCEGYDWWPCKVCYVYACSLRSPLCFVPHTLALFTTTNQVAKGKDIPESLRNHRNPGFICVGYYANNGNHSWVDPNKTTHLKPFDPTASEYSALAASKVVGLKQALAEAIQDRKEASPPFSCRCHGRGDDSEAMILCDDCQIWMHAQCEGLTEDDIDKVDKWYCKVCKMVPGNLATTLKKDPRRRSSRSEASSDVENDPRGMRIDLDGEEEVEPPVQVSTPPPKSPPPSPIPMVPPGKQNS